jgi:hypothetical protein
MNNALLNVSGGSSRTGLAVNVTGGGYGIIVESGNVGIGTTGPGAKLHVYDTGPTAIIAEGNGGTDFVEGYFLAKSNAAARGSGLLTRNVTNATNWFMGNPYSSADNFIISRSTGVFSTSVAQLSNAFVTISNSDDGAEEWVRGWKIG